MTDLVFDQNIIEIIFRFYLPFIILSILIIIYICKRQIIKKYLISDYILIILIVGGIIGTFINIPLYRNADIILFINVGGSVIPLTISGYFLYKLKEEYLIIFLLILLIALMSYLFAMVDERIGFIIEFPYYFIPIIFGTVIPFILRGSNKLRSVIPIAYTACTIGVFVGIDILLIPSLFDNSNIRIGYFGGLGILDFNYIVGIYAIALSFSLIALKRIYTCHKLK